MTYADYLVGRRRKDDELIKHWTEKTVKDHLPHVSVLVDGVTRLTGVLAGRLNDRATIWIYSYLNPDVKVEKFTFYYSPWKNVVDAMNQGRPIEVASPIEQLKQKEVEHVRRRPKGNGRSRGTPKRRKK